MNIEVEIKTFISKEQYLNLLDFFTTHGKKLYEDEQETHYFTGKHDFRIQKNNFGSKITLKKGIVHDECREEMEVPCAVKDFATLQKIFSTLGYETEIKWLRKRHAFKWDNIDITVDHTKGYGYILEMEQMSDPENQEKVLLQLKQKSSELGIQLTPREEFTKKYQWYKENWKGLQLKSK